MRVSLATVSLLVAVGAATPCRYARAWTCDALLRNSSALDAFLLDTAQREGLFHSPGVGYEPTTAYTYDGHPLNYTTGELADAQPHTFSAPSKESLHLGLAALALHGHPLATVFFQATSADVLSILERKIAAYEAFNTSYPGYGCFFPWVSVQPAGLTPMGDFSNPYRVPGLDNGEVVWSVLAVAWELAAANQPALAARYDAWFRCMAANAKAIFYAGQGQVTAVVEILNASGPVVPSNYNHTGGGLLNDPYEGETLTVLLDLFADWSDDPSERDLMWEVKRGNLVAVNYTTSGGEAITVQRGFWFSAHEQWKTMLLPYLDDPLVRDIFANCERVRTLDAAANGIPGLFASVNDVTSGSINIPDYIAAAGIKAVAVQPVTRRDVVTPYGSWPLFLHNASVGACWYRNMLAGSRMQGPYGSTEAAAINGTEISPLVTWDSKITTFLGACGGIANLTAAILNVMLPTTPNGTWSAYERFRYVIHREHMLAFPIVVGQDVDYAVPTASIPLVLPEWPNC